MLITEQKPGQQPARPAARAAVSVPAALANLGSDTKRIVHAVDGPVFDEQCIDITDYGTKQLY